jgi:hypothetical protein
MWTSVMKFGAKPMCKTYLETLLQEKEGGAGFLSPEGSDNRNCGMQIAEWKAKPQIRNPQSEIERAGGLPGGNHIHSARAPLIFFSSSGDGRGLLVAIVFSIISSAVLS